MTKLLQMGMSTAAELHDDFGHIACTLGGVNYESRGGAGCLRGSSARGATSSLFRHQFHRVLTEAEAARAKTYADECVHQPYVLGVVPTGSHGGDCSGYMSGIICSANNVSPVRLFATATWLTRFDDADIKFQNGLGGGMIGAAGMPDPGVLDRPYPGIPFNRTSPKSEHVKWIQARLNFVGHNHHSALDGRALDVDGEFGDDTFNVVVTFQLHRGLQGIGQVGPKTWSLLNAVR